MKKILIAGGSRGLGRATALYFAERDYQVDIAYRRAHESAAEVVAAQPGIRSFACDLSRQEEVQRLADYVRADWAHPLEAIIICCGRESYCLYDQATALEWRQVLDHNLSSAFYLAQALRGDLLRAEAPAIILTSSVWGQCGAAMESLYSAAKAGLIGLGKSLAKELASCGVRVNIIAPGAMDTEMLEIFSEDELAALIEEIPLGRLGTGEDYAKLCYYLVAEDRYMTGQVLGLNGGFYI